MELDGERITSHVNNIADYIRTKGFVVDVVCPVLTKYILYIKPKPLIIDGSGTEFFRGYSVILIFSLIDICLSYQIKDEEYRFPPCCIITIQLLFTSDYRYIIDLILNNIDTRGQLILDAIQYLQTRFKLTYNTATSSSYIFDNDQQYNIYVVETEFNNIVITLICDNVVMIDYTITTMTDVEIFTNIICNTDEYMHLRIPVGIHTKVAKI